MIVMCQCRFTDCNKQTNVVAELVVRKAVCMEGQCVNGNSVLSAQFCCEPKSALKFFY